MRKRDKNEAILSEIADQEIACSHWLVLLKSRLKCAARFLTVDTLNIVCSHINYTDRVISSGELYKLTDEERLSQITKLVNANKDLFDTISTIQRQGESIEQLMCEYPDEPVNLSIITDRRARGLGTTFIIKDLRPLEMIDKYRSDVNKNVNYKKRFIDAFTK